MARKGNVLDPNKEITKAVLLLLAFAVVHTVFKRWNYGLGSGVLAFETFKYAVMFCFFLLPVIIGIVSKIRYKAELAKEEAARNITQQEALEEAYNEAMEPIKDAYRESLRRRRKSSPILTNLLCAGFSIVSVAGLINCFNDFRGGTEHMVLLDAKCINYDEQTKELKEYYELTGIDTEGNTYKYQIKEMDPVVCGVINLESPEVLLTVYPNISKAVKIEIYSDDQIIVIPSEEPATYGSKAEVAALHAEAETNPEDGDTEGKYSDITDNIYGYSDLLDEQVESMMSEEPATFEEREGVLSGTWSDYELYPLDKLELPEYEIGGASFNLLRDLAMEYQYEWVTSTSDNYSTYQPFFNEINKLYKVKGVDECYYCIKDDTVVAIMSGLGGRIEGVFAVKVSDLS